MGLVPRVWEVETDIMTQVRSGRFSGGGFFAGGRPRGRFQEGFSPAVCYIYVE